MLQGVLERAWREYVFSGLHDDRNSWLTRKARCCTEGGSRFLYLDSGVWHSKVGLGLERCKLYPLYFYGFLCAEAFLPKIKRKLSDDPRYDAVGSSTLREELFNAFLKARGSSDSKNHQDEVDKPQSSTPVEEAEVGRKRQEKRERALKEREEQVRVQRGRTEVEIGKSRLGLTQEEGERVFR